jgi:hypothetical protein
MTAANVRRIDGADALSCAVAAFRTPLRRRPIDLHQHGTVDVITERCLQPLCDNYLTLLWLSQALLRRPLF